MEPVKIDLKKEQQASRARPRYPYSAVARVFFGSMDMLTGKQTTLAAPFGTDRLLQVRVWVALS